MSGLQIVCESCGAPARVHVLQGYVDAQPVVRHACVACTPHVATALPAGAARRGRPSVAVLFALVGVSLGALGILADLFVPDAQPGFGWHQRLGLVGGAVIGLTGVFLQADLLVLGGLLLVGATVTADWFGTRSPGVGWKQGVFVGVALGCVGIAAVLYLLVHRGARQPHHPDPGDGA